MTRFGLGVRDPVANYLCIYCAPYLHQNKDWPRIYWHRISIKTKTGLGARDPIANYLCIYWAPYLHQNKDWPRGTWSYSQLPVYLLAPYLHQNKDWPRGTWSYSQLPVYLLAPYLHQNKDWPRGTWSYSQFTCVSTGTVSTSKQRLAVWVPNCHRRSPTWPWWICFVEV